MIKKAVNLLTSRLLTCNYFTLIYNKIIMHVVTHCRLLHQTRPQLNYPFDTAPNVLNEMKVTAMDCKTINKPCHFMVTKCVCSANTMQMMAKQDSHWIVRWCDRTQCHQTRVITGSLAVAECGLTSPSLSVVHLSPPCPSICLFHNVCII